MHTPIIILVAFIVCPILALPFIIRMWIHGQPGSSSMKLTTGRQLHIGNALILEFIMNFSLEATKLCTKSEAMSLTPSTFHS